MVEAFSRAEAQTGAERSKEVGASPESLFVMWQHT